MCLRTRVPPATPRCGQKRCASCAGSSGNGSASWPHTPPGTPCLVAPSARVRFHESLDLLRKAGEDVPAWLYRRGSLVRTRDAAGGTTVGVSLVSLLADVARVLEWVDTDHERD